MDVTFQSLHKLEEQIFEIIGLMQALQMILPDGAAHTCVVNAIEDKLNGLEQLFSEHWPLVVEIKGAEIPRRVCRNKR